MDSCEKFNKSLPSKDKSFSSMTGNVICDKDCEHSESTQNEKYETIS